MGSSSNLKRAHSMNEFLQIMERFLSKESMENCYSFRPSSTDVIITTFPKSGTTWMQQIAHCLRSYGDMTFDEISIAVPWMEVAFDMGLDLEDEQHFSPRLFKSHLTAEEVPLGAKYIVIFRDPGDVLLSYYNFMEDWFFESGNISLENFANGAFFETEGFENYWHHFRTWWHRKDDPDVLSFCYENMKLDVDSVIRKVARFLNIELSQALFDITKEYSSHSFMKMHEHQFDEHRTQQALNKKCGLPEGGHGSKVRSRPDNFSPLKLTNKLKEQLTAHWEVEISKKLGITSYSEFKKSMI